MKKDQLTILLICYLAIWFFASCDDATKDKKGILLFENLKLESKDSLMVFNNKKYTGPVVKYFNDGILEFKGFYKDGIKDGPWKYYHPDGKLQREETAQPSQGKYEVKTYRSRSGRLYTELLGENDDTIHFKKYHHNGKTGQQLVQKDGNRIFQKWTSLGNLYHYYNSDSLVITMDTKTKEIIHKGRFVNGKRDGFWFKYRRNGNKEYEKNYKLGELVGRSVDYFNNGNIDMISNYNSNGLLEGDYKRYHMEGGIWVDGEYDYLGKRTGTWLYYNEKGKLTRLSTYYSGELYGYYEEYGPQGRMREKGYYERNRKVGIWFYYDTYGKFLRKENEGPKSSTFKINLDRVL